MKKNIALFAASVAIGFSLTHEIKPTPTVTVPKMEVAHSGCTWNCETVSGHYRSNGAYVESYQRARRGTSIYNY